ncbi:MAG: hypothetical protein ACRESV_04575 [Nevskiales bacterium]
MKRHRTLLSVLLGLVLLVQGVAVSAAPLAMFSESGQTTVSMNADMPCHGQMDDQAVTDPASCCDADCPDMTSCMLGHLAFANTVHASTPHSPDEFQQLIPVRVITRAPSSLLRPPITLHG